MQDLVCVFRECGYEGPIPGPKHPFMKRERRKVRIPNPHGKDIDWDFACKVFGQADIPKEKAAEILGIQL